MSHMRITESALRRIIREELLEGSYTRGYSRPSEVSVVSPFMWYEDRLFVVAEYERFIGGPKIKTGFYTSRGESVADTEHMASSWQPCFGINKSDGWIKKMPGKWVDPGSLLDMVSGELSRRYGDAWQRQKRAELYSALRARNRGKSRSEIGETQIDPINDEFRKHGVLFDRNFVNRSLESDQDIEDYHDFAERMREGRSRRRGILREARIDAYSLPAGVTFKLKVSDSWGAILLVALKRDFEIGRIEASMRNIDVQGPCREAFVIGYSRSQIDGLGPLMYDIVMEAATEIGGGLISDRFVVSDDAQRVWRKYQEDRPDVDRKQLDSMEDELTPGEEDDNCDVRISKSYAREEWADFPLSGAYRKPGMETIRRLVNLRKMQVDGLDI